MEGKETLREEEKGQMEKQGMVKRVVERRGRRQHQKGQNRERRKEELCIES